MTTITTKRHPLKFYLGMTLVSIFYVGLGSLMINMFYEHMVSTEIASKPYFALVFGFLCIFMAFYTVIKYSKNAPKVTVDETKISFNSEVFYWKDVDQIELTGKKPFPYVVTFPLEGAMIRLKSGVVKYFFDDMYSNSWKLKSFIQQVIVSKQLDYVISIGKVGVDEVRLENFEIFKGNQITSFRGISLWGMLGFFCVLTISGNGVTSRGAFIALFVIGFIWFVLHSFLMNYFGLSDKFFSIRNHNFLWSNTLYRVSEIREIVFETSGKMPNCLRVITRDFRNKLYPAGTLRDNAWLDLKSKLELKGISVRNECILGEQK